MKQNSLEETIKQKEGSKKYRQQQNEAPNCSAIEAPQKLVINADVSI